MREKWIWMDWRMMVKHRGSKCDAGKMWDHTVKLIMKSISVTPKSRNREVKKSVLVRARLSSDPFRLKVDFPFCS